MQRPELKRVAQAVCLATLPFGIALAVPLPARSLHAAAAARRPTQRSVWDSVYTAAQAARGDSVYGQDCADCHSSTLSGIEDAPPLAGAEFMGGWGGKSVGDLFDKIRRTMPQDSRTTLTAAQNADVVAYILSYNRFPAGAVELLASGDTLKQIRIEAKPDSSRGKP